MMESVIGLLADREAAPRVRSALIEAGCDEGSVVIFGREAGQELAEELEERGLAEERGGGGRAGGRARQYAEAVMRGGILVAAEAEKVDKALTVMNRFEL